MSAHQRPNAGAGRKPPISAPPAPRRLLVWHRRVGLASGVFLLFFVISGIPLHYTDALGLDRRHIDWEPLLHWYGIHGPEAIVTYPTNAGPVSLVGEQLYLGRRRIPGQYESLAGAAAFAHGVAVAVDGGLLLLTEDAEVIERIAAVQALDGAVRRLAPRADGGLVVGDGGNRIASGPDLVRWREAASDGAIQWSRPSSPGPALESDLRRRYRQGQLSWERVLLDLHSGRILGDWGVMLMDAVAVALAFLVLTGFWFWYRPRRGPPGYTDVQR